MAAYVSKHQKASNFIEFYKKHEAHHISFLTLPLKQMMGAPYLDFEMWDSEDLALNVPGTH
jgi:hypothetical protein